MYNYSILAEKIKRKNKIFIDKLSKGLNKTEYSFLFQMFYGLLGSGSVLLSEISRTLEENIILKKTIERLSRNLKNFDKIQNGYKIFEIAALSKEKKMPISVYSRVFSPEEDNHISENRETLDGFRYLSKEFGNEI